MAGGGFDPVPRPARAPGWWAVVACAAAACVGKIGAAGTSTGGVAVDAGGTPSIGGSGASRGGAVGMGGHPAGGTSSAAGGSLDAGGSTTIATDAGTFDDLKPTAPFVAVGYAALRAYSPDGKSWMTAAAPAALPSGWTGPPVSGDNQWLFRSGCYGAGRFIAVGGTSGDLGLLMWSSNGTSWTLAGQQSNDDCAYGLGRFLTSVRTSTDGVTWSKIATPISTRQIVFGNGTFVSVADNGGGDVAYSRDGMTWTTLPITYVGTDSNRLGYNAVAYGKGRYIAINLGINASPIFEWDGSSRTSFTETPRASLLGGNVAVTALAYGRGAFVLATANALFRRADGSTTWQSTPLSGTPSISALVITDSLYVTPAAWSPDGRSFTPATNAPTQTVTRIVPTLTPP
jgi:hypothetical protein